MYIMGSKVRVCVCVWLFLLLLFVELCVFSVDIKHIVSVIILTVYNTSNAGVLLFIVLYERALVCMCASLIGHTAEIPLR